MLNEPTLDHCNQITVVIGHNESDRASSPSTQPLEFGKVLAMVLVVGIEGHIGPSMEL
jgi:hypothetical protein